MIPSALNPRKLMLFAFEIPHKNEKKWLRSYHVRRELRRADGK